MYIYFRKIFIWEHFPASVRGGNIKRKVILHGPSTLTVSLPSKWVKNHNIIKGDELNIEEAGSILRIYPGEEHLLTKKIKIDFSDKDWGAIHSILAVLHKSGYDEIEIIFNNPETAKIIQERINTMLMGYEIIEQKGSICTVKNVSGDHLSELDALTRRIFLVAISLAKNSLEAIKIGNKDKMREVLVLEQTINKLTNYCQRLLNKKPYKDEKTIYTYLIIWVLESICDDYRDIINLFLEKPRKITQPVIDVYAEINELLEHYYTFFYRYSDKELISLRDKIKSLKQELLRIKFKSREEPLRLCLFSILNRIFDCLGSTVGMHH
jgi:phosphate uptake regulator